MLVKAGSDGGNVLMESSYVASASVNRGQSFPLDHHIQVCNYLLWALLN